MHGTRYGSVFGPNASSGAQWGRILSENQRPITPSSDYADLPRPSTDPAVLEADYMKFGHVKARLVTLLCGVAAGPVQ